MKPHLLAYALPLILFGAAATARADVDYQLRITDAAQHLAEVRASFPATPGTTLDVSMPNWRTGRYNMLNLANGVRLFKAFDAKGAPLAVTKTDKGTWRVTTKPGDAVTVQYELYANTLGERTRHIDDTHAYLDASGVFVYAAPFRKEPVKVKLDVPQGWQSRSGMESGACGHCFVAADYDVLVDAPIETGVHEFHTAQVDGKTIELALWGRGNHDGKQIMTDLKKIVVETAKLYKGKYPFQRYLFIVHATDGVGGATEHANSTVIQTPRWNFAPRKQYLNFLRTAAHEFYHTWNVKAYRPKEMVPYDYQNENYNRLLWVAEGHTSYFEELIVLRAGIEKREEFMEEYAKLIDDYQHQPGRFQQSAADASFDEWIAVGGERARNASVNIYSKGQLLALMMDLELRRQTNNARGLEDVHRILFEQHSTAQGGYDVAAMQAALRAVSGQDWRSWWATYVDGTAEIPFDTLLAQAGLQKLVDVPKDQEQKTEWWAGWTLREGSDPAVVTVVERDGPAWKAGVVAGDTLVAVNGLRVSAKDIADKMSLTKAGPFNVHLFRRDELVQLQLAPTQQPKGKAKIKALDKPGAAQKALNAAWLGVAWPKEEARKP
ncbi:M61 family metallopeptidase [Massilia yuzhufengensis]|uniref:Predicted metalloprotease, contains C-terminal PDZ domain n=1 Tax=Massilia yuzhufengensis TaxID=1164594 RepID=A0A1I1VB05_9BURK|nr:PDZ domain-containing protein [Massilia yuzhufengensis]SFD80192.1 Predicted metalloprotease, contains C-terminal PDZ domain [Massilia yuzhufengensis]